MLRKLLLAYSVSALMIIPVSAQYVQVGEGGYSGSNAGGPMNSTTLSNAWCKYAYIWPQSFLGNLKHGDTIRSIEFYKDVATAMQATPSLSIWMGMADSAGFRNVPLSFSAEAARAGMVKVYDRNPTADVAGIDGWKKFPFHIAPFVVDTTKGRNLKILVAYSQTGAQSANIPWLYENRFSLPGLAIGQTRFQNGTGTPTDTLRNASDVHPTMILNYPRSDRDLMMMKLYTLGKLPVPLGNPDTIRALVRNVGKKTLSGQKVLVRSKGANVLADSTVLPDIASGEQRFVNLKPLNAQKTGWDTLTATALRDANRLNDTAVCVRIATTNIYSYKDPTQPPASGGIGFNGTTGDFVARFSSNSPKSINQITITYGFGGQPCRIGIWEQNKRTGGPGKNIWTSASFNTQTGNVVLPVWPPVAVSGVFYVGVRQTGTQNVAFGYQLEDPVRPQHFYYAAPTGDTNWVDFAPAAPFRFLIEPRIQAEYDVAAESILVPKNKDTLDKFTLKTIAPKGTIFNFGAKKADSVYVTMEVWRYGVKIYSSTKKDSLSSGLRRTITFDSTLLPADLREHQVLMYTRLAKDQMQDNDTAKATFYVAMKRDVAVDALFEPSLSSYEYKRDTIWPIARIQNNGVDAQGPFDVKAEIRNYGKLLYSSTKSITLGSEKGQIQSFDPYPCKDTGSMLFTVYTTLSVDRLRVNDTMRFKFRVDKSNDVGFSKGVFPAKDTSLNPTTLTFAPSALLNNYGVLSQLNNFLVSCRIVRNGTQVYFDTTRVPSYVGAPGLISFARKFRPDRKGVYTIQFRSFLKGDQEPVNDSITYKFQVGRAHDLVAVSILKPAAGATLGIGSGPYRAWVSFRNNGFLKPSGPVPFTAQIWKDGKMLYYSIRTTTLDTGETRLFLFDSTFIPTLPGIYTVKAFVSDVEDPFRSNDTVSSWFNVEKEIDVLVKSISSPAPGSMYRVKQDAVKASAIIANESKKAISSPFQTAFEIRDPLNRLAFARYVSDTLAYNGSTELTMPDSFVPSMPGKHRIWVFTRLITDQYRLNDTQSIEFIANATIDAALLRIQNPDVRQEFRIPGGVVPSVWLKNQSSGSASGINVRFEAFDSASGQLRWMQSGTAPALNSGDSVLITAPGTWNINQVGTYLLRIAATLSGDVYSGNDTLFAYLRAVDPLKIYTLWNTTFMLKPNPAQLEVQLYMPEGAAGKLKLTDASGRTFMELSAGNQIIDIRILAQGVYFLQWETPYGRMVKRLVKD
ncbi:MAG: T9SS type A sorting domain-containing protein [Bacteroidetes bacterium]|nr:T9SS type A sorting domain-containing protein [Bacteroidota bacterium]